MSEVMKCSTKKLSLPSFSGGIWPHSYLKFLFIRTLLPCLFPLLNSVQLCEHACLCNYKYSMFSTPAMQWWAFIYSLWFYGFCTK